MLIAPSGKNAIGHLNPRVVSLQLGTTTESSLLVSTKLNFTNPTEYSATIPFVDTLMLYNGTAIAHIIAHNISVVPGNNTNVSVDFAWNPLEFGGMEGVEAGRALLSSYISGTRSVLVAEFKTGAHDLSRCKHNRHPQNSQRHHSYSPRHWRSPVDYTHRCPRPSIIYTRIPR